MNYCPFFQKWEQKKDYDDFQLMSWPPKKSDAEKNSLLIFIYDV